MTKKTVKKTAKQIAAATRNILAYEKMDDSANVLRGFVIGAVTVFLAAIIALAL